MQIAIKNKWVSLGDSSTVQDLEGKDLLKVKGKVFSITRVKTIMDLYDSVKYVVRNKFWSIFGRTAIVYDGNGVEVVRVKRKIFSLHDHYTITSTLGNIEIIGNILGFNYKILLNGEEVGHISRKISLRDSFVLTIPDDADYALYVALVLAIDNITDRRIDAMESDVE